MIFGPVGMSTVTKPGCLARGRAARRTVALCLAACVASCGDQIDWGDQPYPTPQQIAEAEARIADDDRQADGAGLPPVPRPKALRRLAAQGLAQVDRPEEVTAPDAEAETSASVGRESGKVAELGEESETDRQAQAVSDPVALAFSEPIQRIQIATRAPSRTGSSPGPEDDGTGQASLLELLLQGNQPRTLGAATGVGSTESAAGSALRDVAPATDPAMIRAPELFQASGLAKWNGQRTVRGVWVAHPRARGSRRVRIVNSQTGAEIDGMLYRPERAENGDVITVSSDAASALGLLPDRPALLALFGLRPQGSTSRSERRAVEDSAFGELASHVLRMEENQLLQLVAAAMRGMGYATVFENGPPGQDLAAIRAFPRPDAGFQLPAIRVVVRPSSKPAMGASGAGKLYKWLTGSGDLGVVVSVPGFLPDAASGFAGDGPHVEMVDLDGLLNIWLTHYESLSGPDQALLPLQPVYFLAGN